MLYLRKVCRFIHTGPGYPYERTKKDRQGRDETIKYRDLRSVTIQTKQKLNAAQIKKVKK